MFNRLPTRRIGGMGGVYKPPQSRGVINKPAMPITEGVAKNFLQKSKGALHQVSNPTLPFQRFGNNLARIPV